MTIDTHIDPDYISKHWPLGYVRMGPILREFDHRRVQVVWAREGRYVLKTTNQWRDDLDAANHLSLPEYLARRGFLHTPALLPTRAGRLFETLGSQHVYLLEYISGREPDPSLSSYTRLGAMMASLHTVAGYAHPYLFTFQEALPDFYEIARNLPFGSKYLEIVRAWPDFDALPHTIIHGEIIGNTLQSNDGRLVILDWDEAGLGTRILDLGHPLIGAFVNEDLQVRWDLMAAFYRGYLAHIRITDIELQHILDAALFYALRYIIWGDIDKRWRRILWALDHRTELGAVIAEAALSAR